MPPTKNRKSLPGIVELDEMVDLLGYKNRKSLIRAIREDRFEIELTRMGNRWVAHIDAIQKFLDDMAEKTDMLA